MINDRRSEEEMNQLDAILPKTEAEKASIKLNSLLNQNKKVLLQFKRTKRSGGDH